MAPPDGQFSAPRLRRTIVQDRERKNEGATRGLKRSPPLFCPSAFSSQPLAFLSRLPSFPLLPPPGRGTPIIFQLRQTFGRASPSAPLLMQRCRGREGDPGRPKGGRSAKAGADIARPTGPGRFAPMPRATRGGRGTAQYGRQLSRYRKAGCTGCRGLERFNFEKGETRGGGTAPPGPK